MNPPMIYWRRLHGRYAVQLTHLEDGVDTIEYRSLWLYRDDAIDREAVLRLDCHMRDGTVETELVPVQDSLTALRVMDSLADDHEHRIGENRG